MNYFPPHNHTESSFNDGNRRMNNNESMGQQEYTASLLNGSNRKMNNNHSMGQNDPYHIKLSSYSNNFSLIVVLFILLIVVGVGVWPYGNNKKRPRKKSK